LLSLVPVYLLATYIPERHKRNFLKTKLNYSYKKMKKSILDILEFKDKDIDTEKLLNYKGFRSHEKNKLGNFCIFVCSDGDADIGDSYIKKIHNEF
jgi:hypothetical protein